MPNVPESTTAKYSNGTTPFAWQALTRRELTHAPIADKPQQYLIILQGKDRGREISAEWIFEARHPLIALGLAVVRFGHDYLFACLTACIIKKQQLKKTQKTSKTAR